MIQANELRIGNIIDYFGNMCIVKSIKYDPAYYLIVATDTNGYTQYGNNIDAFEPIPLTEDWLLRFGFEKDSIIGLYILFKIGYFKVWFDVKNNTYLIDNVRDIKLYIKYVHQLQNLYFALIGEELKVK